jgi:hypothetical protein
MVKVGRIGVEPIPSGLKSRRSTSELTTLRVLNCAQHGQQVSGGVFPAPINPNAIVAPHKDGFACFVRQEYFAASGQTFTSGGAQTQHAEASLA